MGGYRELILKPKKTLTVGINGFGRIGRQIARHFAHHEHMSVALINDPFLSPEYMAYLINYDSVHGGALHTASFGDDCIHMNGKKSFIISTKTPTAEMWEKRGVQLVFEASGTIKNKTDFIKIIGEKIKGIITAPVNDDTKTVVIGVNDSTISASDQILSNASCTTNCIAPLVKLIDQLYGIEEGFVTTVHAVTATQSVVDGPAHGGKNWRAGRAASANIVPTSTGAANAVGLVYPQIKGKLTGMAFRVPVLDVSVADMTLKLKKPTKLTDLLAAMRQQIDKDMPRIVGMTQDQVVSQDFVGDLRSSIVDEKACMALSDNFVKIISWYDNEAAYSARTVELAIMLMESA